MVDLEQMKFLNKMVSWVFGICEKGPFPSRYTPIDLLESGWIAPSLENFHEIEGSHDAAMFSS